MSRLSHSHYRALSAIDGLIEELRTDDSRQLVGGCTPGASWPDELDALAVQATALVNQHRAGLGRTSLALHAGLVSASTWKARHMAAYEYMQHDDPAPPVARAWSDRVAACGYAGGYAGENIAEGFPDAQSVVTAWLNSPGHRANIENATYNATGMAAAKGANGAVYWCQDFGVGSSPPPPPPPVLTVGSVFDNTFAPAMRAAGLYKTWAEANPGEANLLAAYIAKPSATLPAMKTDTGLMLASAVLMRFVSGT